MRPAVWLPSLLSIALLVVPAASVAQTVGAAADGAHGCSGSGMNHWELTRQLARAQACMFPDALVEITPGGGLSISSGTLPFASPGTRSALYGVRDSGIAFNVNSAFRHVLQQYWLYTARSPACGSVATPGSSNHESGSAVDIQQYGAVRSAMAARGCNWPNFSADPWHFDCPTQPRRTVLVFQRLWNLNNPGDRIAEDGSWGPMTQARLRASPTAGFANDGCAPVVPPCDNTAGRFTFSCDGENAGAYCVSVNEPADPDSWSDNFVCSAGDVGFRWSNAGPIDGMRCVNTAESADSHAVDWADNYACAPIDAPYELRWSSAGPIDGYQCVHFNEPADSGSWTDNFLCARAVSCFTAAGFTFCGSGPADGQACESVDEPNDVPGTWSDNYFCASDEVGGASLGMVWSSAGPLDGMTCTAVTESSDTHGGWDDNYLCLPEDAAYAFTWSSAGPIAGMDCVRWYEAADLVATWDDNYLCVTPVAPPVLDGGGSTRDAGPTGDVGAAMDAGTGGRDGGLSAGCGCHAQGRGKAPLSLIAGLLACLIVRRRAR